MKIFTAALQKVILATARNTDDSVNYKDYYRKWLKLCIVMHS